MPKTDLLDRVIKKTVSESGNRIIKVNNTKDLMALATVSYEKKKVKKLSCQKKERLRMFNEVLGDITFFFQQYLNQSVLNKDSRKIIFLNNRLEALLDSIDEEIEDFSDVVFDKIKSDDLEKNQTAVFVLASVRKDIKSSMYLDDILSELSGVDTSITTGVIEGLKHGFHPQINQALLKLIEKATPKTQAACLEILEYRNANK